MFHDLTNENQANRANDHISTNAREGDVYASANKLLNHPDKISIRVSHDEINHKISIKRQNLL